MNFRKNYTKIYLAAVGLLSALLLLLILINSYTTISTVMTGMFYEPLPSHCYVQKGISKIINGVPASVIHPGDFIIGFNNTKCDNFEDYKSAFSWAKDSSVVQLKFFTSTGHNVKEISIFKYDIPSDFAKDLSYGVMIFQLNEGGTAARVGIRPGDILLSISGYPTTIFGNKALKFLRSLRPGQVVEYEILRANESRIFKLKVAMYGIQFNFISYFLTGIFCFLFGVFITVKKPDMVSARLVGLAFILIGSHFALTLNLNPIDFNFFSKARYILYYLTIIFGYPVFAHSLLYFPTERPDLIKKKWLKLSPYFISFITFFILIFTASDEHYYFLEMTTTVFNVTQSLFIVLCGLLYRKRLTRENKRIRKPVEISISIVFITLAIYLLFYLVIFPYQAPLWLEMRFYIVFLFLLIPISYIYTIFRYRLLEIDIKIKRTVQYSLISFFWKAVIIIFGLIILFYFSHITFYFPRIYFTGSTIEISDQMLDPVRNEILEKFIFVVVSLLISKVLWALWKKGQTVVDRMFYRTRFDYRVASFEMTGIIEASFSLEAMAKELVDKLGNLLKLKRIGVIFFKSEDKIINHNYYCTECNEFEKFINESDTALIDALRQYDGVVRIDYLSTELKMKLRSKEFQYIIPIKSKKKLVGVLLIGEKLSESSFTDDDFDFLSTISNQAATSIDNALLYEDLKSQERMNHELELARKIQSAQLPQSIPHFDRLDIAGICLPATEVGGDFYDYLTKTDDEFGIVIGDVSGKGTSAALYMSKVQGIVRTLYEFGTSPRELLSGTNHLLWHYLDKFSFITLIAGYFDINSSKLILSRAGHLPVYHYNTFSGKIEKIVPHGLALGLKKGNLFLESLEEYEINYNPGDIFVFITDGIIEARNPQMEDFDEPKLIEALYEIITGSSEEIKSHIIEKVQNFAAGESQFDDMTLVVVKIR